MRDSEHEYAVSRRLKNVKPRFPHRKWARQKTSHNIVCQEQACGAGVATGDGKKTGEIRVKFWKEDEETE